MAYSSESNMQVFAAITFFFSNIQGFNFGLSPFLSKPIGRTLLSSDSTPIHPTHMMTACKKSEDVFSQDGCHWLTSNFLGNSALFESHELYEATVMILHSILLISSGGIDCGIYSDFTIEWLSFQLPCISSQEDFIVFFDEGSWKTWSSCTLVMWSS